MAPSFLNSSLDVGKLHTPASLLPGKQLPDRCCEEAVWSPEPVWALWNKEKYIFPAVN
jgi:hypothetical protein